jgi:hypothetical protein
LNTDIFDVEEGYSYNMNNKDKRKVKKLSLNILSLLRKNGINFKEEK